MESPNKGPRPSARVPLDLDRFIPQRDVRKLIWRHLTQQDRELIRCAHNPQRSPLLHLSMIDHCAEMGYLSLIPWAFSHGCGWGTSTYRNAAKCGHVHVLEWLLENHCPRSGECVSEVGAFFGHSNVVQWAWTNRLKWSAETCMEAAVSGHFKILEWARAHLCPWDERTCSEAAFGGHLEILQWARAHYCPWDSMRTCLRAAAGGQLGVLEWALANGAVWDASICLEASQAGHLNVLQWAHAKGYPWDRMRCLYYSYDAAVVAWIRQIL
jgi:hypothetical protein